ncbi:MAG: enoyl-ACP reductase [Woeseiaceae bacterium]|nr:enoyl-ACP reductase [Woeseiaceae bacterium]
MGFMAGKKALIVGVASDRSIATGIAEAFAREGAELAFTYQNDKLRGRVLKLAERLGQNTELLFPCDVTSDDEIESVFGGLKQHWDGLDVLVHSVGFAPRDQLEGGFTEAITREGFAVAHDISAYSLAGLTKAARPMLTGRNSAVLALTYNAAVRVVPNYNVMGLAKASLESCVRFLAADLGPDGIRVNCISAGPVKTLAAAGIGGFRKMLNYAEKSAPLKRTVTIEEIGNTAAFLCSDLASGITGETTFVDAGSNIMAMVFDEDE